ncbi:zinc-ribbon domain-containing protein [Jannaschia sp. CCS1]|uniref:zinc-ribbon domain-containing protein n=1 Tax=Jannaschia sp. (strain CCS1) TaxID=290400 RepID=UPI00006BFF82|nr:zinc-ribbon domain-containing protein [Jannaschia sp. CCS1]ABD53396.1 Zinc finger/thioredoxin putative [Jannaschia sp. CCS1]
MRLTCPNCSARYEVDEDMVPASGRDVQCSNCSQTWFQPGPRRTEPKAPEPETDAPEVETAQEEPRLAEVSVDGPSGAPGEEATEDEPRPARRQIDPNVTDILREEAEREARLRRSDPAPDPAPQQEEMPLTEEPSTQRERRLADLEGAADAFDTDQITAAVATAAAASRREQFPDIEEINSTLRATGDRHEGAEDGTDVDTVSAASRRRGSVRRGFFSVILLACIAVGIYAYAGQIAEAVPQLGPALEQYVDAVNSARFWLDDMARSLAGETGN